jgi:hypothetical protein
MAFAKWRVMQVVYCLRGRWRSHNAFAKATPRQSWVLIVIKKRPEKCRPVAQGGKSYSEVGSLSVGCQSHSYQRRYERT